jgi:phosphinothricin acetyltransferase
MPSRESDGEKPLATGHRSPATQLVIREAELSDAGQIAAIYAPYVRDTPISFEVEPPSAAEIGARIGANGATYPWLVCVGGARVQGYAYASQHRERAAYQWSVDVTVYVDASAHRRGIGRALYAALLPLVAAQGFYNGYAGITLPNPSSVGLHEAMGFAPIGVYRRVGFKLGAWHDVGWWALQLRPAEAPPVPAQPVGVLRGTREWDAALAAGTRWLRP